MSPPEKQLMKNQHMKSELQKGKIFQKMAKKIYFGERLYENQMATITN